MFEDKGNGETIMNTERDFDNAAEQWLRTHRYTADAQVLTQIGRRVHALLEQNGGFVSTAHYHRAYLELVFEKAIRPFRGTVSEHASNAPAIPQDTIDFIESPRTSAWELDRRYRSDPTFRKQYDAYEQFKGQKLEQQPGVVSLSVEEYNKIPTATIAARYQRDRSFRIAVDKLISEGRI